ncbi:MAG: methanogen output domain 1-containing protein [Candidatus Velthaea sp.]|jgi:predicted ArsR family transcriptional regulator
MHGDWFFDTARGKIVAALRGRRGASAFDLAREFGLSTNAVRQQFILLERDGLVTASSVRRGKTKPTVEYRLTPAAEKYFPQHYDRMLNAVLREVRANGGDDAVAAIFQSMSRRQADRLNADVEERPVAERVAALTDLLRESGVEAKAEETAAGFTIHEQNCPYAETVGEHPEICGLIRSVIQDVVAPGVVQTDSLATGGTECRFEITTGNKAAREDPATGES